MICNDFLSNVIRFDTVSDRISVLRLKSLFSHTSIINAYTPTEMSSDEAKDNFFNVLESVYNQLSSYDIKMLTGDFNAKVGQKEAFVPTIAIHSKHSTSNDNGISLISFAKKPSMD